MSFSALFHPFQFTQCTEVIHHGYTILPGVNLFVYLLIKKNKNKIIFDIFYLSKNQAMVILTIPVGGDYHESHTPNDEYVGFICVITIALYAMTMGSPWMAGAGVEYDTLGAMLRYMFDRRAFKRIDSDVNYTNYWRLGRHTFWMIMAIVFGALCFYVLYDEDLDLINNEIRQSAIGGIILVSVGSWMFFVGGSFVYAHGARIFFMSVGGIALYSGYFPLYMAAARCTTSVWFEWAHSVLFALVCNILIQAFSYFKIMEGYEFSVVRDLPVMILQFIQLGAWIMWGVTMTKKTYCN